MNAALRLPVPLCAELREMRQKADKEKKEEAALAATMQKVETEVGGAAAQNLTEHASTGACAAALPPAARCRWLGVPLPPSPGNSLRALRCACFPPPAGPQEV